MPQKIQIGDKWYVAATAATTEDQPQVLKNDQTFAMYDRFGDIQVLAPGKEGLYHNDTRCPEVGAIGLQYRRPGMGGRPPCAICAAERP